MFRVEIDFLLSRIIFFSSLFFSFILLSLIFYSSLAGQTIFWTDVESDVINRAFWNGSNQQTLVANDLESPAGITCLFLYLCFRFRRICFFASVSSGFFSTPPSLSHVSCVNALFVTSGQTSRRCHNFRYSLLIIIRHRVHDLPCPTSSFCHFKVWLLTG